jgi:hypothetical protein
MTDDRGTLRKIAWRDLCPWLVIFRTFWLSLSLPLLFLATAGVLLQPIGWNIARIFVSQETFDERPDFRQVHHRLSTWPAIDSPSNDLAQATFARSSIRSLVPIGSGDYAGVFDRLSFPFAELFDRQITLGMFCYYLFGGLWTLALWALIGGAITRVAVVYLGLEERLSMRDALTYTIKRFGSYFVAPLYPLLGVLLLALPIALLGLLLRFDVGVIIAGVLWFFALLAALGIAFLAVGLLFGWPLMWPAISAENGDAFEALNRSFGYTFQRPFHYLFYFIVSTLFAALCWLLVINFAGLVIEMGWWGATFGAGQRVEALRQIAAHSVRPENVTASLWAGTRVLNFWNGLVLSVAWGFAYSLFFCLASTIYLLLRQVDDETELDEVYMDDDDDRFVLPEVKRDAAGVPTMTTPTDAASPGPATTSDRPLAEEE